MRLLVTNDDGIGSPGLHALVRALVDDGNDVLVAAPSRDYSGMSAALGPLHMTGKIDFDRVRLDDLDCEVVSVDGPPALCVLAACLGGFGAKPDMVLSGINAGANTGRAVLHSGTVGAALTGLNFDLPGIAVSQVTGDPHEWAAAATMAASLVERVIALRPTVVVNLNVPNRPLADIRGPIEAELDRSGTVRATMIEREEGELELRLPEGGGVARPGSDNALLAEGFATVTPLTGPHAADVDVARLLGRRISA
jgi:5'-nucleotidase